MPWAEPQPVPERYTPAPPHVRSRCGIKYLDQGSRSAGQGTRNYVVFDDKLIDIVKKYGIAGALSAGLINQMQAQQLTEHGYQ